MNFDRQIAEIEVYRISLEKKGIKVGSDVSLWVKRVSTTYVGFSCQFEREWEWYQNISQNISWNYKSRLCMGMNPKYIDNAKYIGQRYNDGYRK